MTRTPNRQVLSATFLVCGWSACVGDNVSDSQTPGADGGGQEVPTIVTGDGDDGTRADSGLSDGSSLRDASVATPRSLGVGKEHACSALTDGTIWCWGSNSHGQLGVPLEHVESATPVRVPDIATATAVTAGVDHTCALLESGKVVCFGSNERGQLGVPLAETGTSTPLPVEVQGLSGPAMKVSAGTDHTCVVLRDLSGSCFGAPAYTSCIAGLPELEHPAPAPSPRSPGAGPFIDVQSGDSHTCFLSSPTKQWRCMGINYWGEFGFPKVWSSPDSVDSFLI